MRLSDLERIGDAAWRLPPTGFGAVRMRVPAVIHASETLVADMDDHVLEQLRNVASLPGVVQAVHAMPDAHQGYGFPIGGVAAFDADEGGVVSAGGVGFDISCGVRAIHAGVDAAAIRAVQKRLADLLYKRIPAGLGGGAAVRLGGKEMDAMLAGGARWAVDRGYGEESDLERVEERGVMRTADPKAVSEAAKQRQADEVGTLGSGNHYLEVQEVAEISDPPIAQALGLVQGGALASIHCGSRGLGHQIATEYIRKMILAAPAHGLTLPDRDLACAPIHSALGREYLGAMNAAVNCALANRQVLTHLVRQVWREFFPQARTPLLYDVSHNACKVETHLVDGNKRKLHVHRKGATRAFGPGHPDLPPQLRSVGQPVLIGGSMGTASYVLAGAADSQDRAFSSACHGAGRAMSRRQALQAFDGREVVRSLAAQGILVRGHALRGVAEEAPQAYKDVSAVVQAAETAGLVRVVARLRPLICIKG